eukprot:TRINITY_DN1743_c0_g1_i1.p1 TRINITY_DN1743_c0_g1~~TRINITY_DN1743_c0_g1_i1.p1  ORF type:complete len:314 (-),score=63.68 TRINITY_DN1743_c0_g1_i1:643-1527(-)
MAEQEKPRAKRRKGQDKKPDGWVDMKQNSNLYVSGLPKDVTIEELNECFTRYGGLIRPDFETQKPKIKVYRNDSGEAKGDALICFVRHESVQQAVNLTDGMELRPGFPLKVEAAKFEQRGNYVKKVKKPKHVVARERKLLEQQLAWTGDDEDTGKKVVILKHMFDPAAAEVLGDPNFYADLQNDIEDECNRSCGEVEKVKMFENQPEGIVSVIFVDSDSAAKCIEVMNNRWFAGRKVEAFYWNGMTDYRVKESKEIADKRLQQWDQWVEQQDAPVVDPVAVAAEPQTETPSADK